MNKEEFVKFAGEKSGFPAIYVRETIEDFTNWIIEAVTEGYNVKLVGFGSFKIKEAVAKEINDPATINLPKEQRRRIKIGPRKKVIFEPGTLLQEAAAKNN